MIGGSSYGWQAQPELLTADYVPKPSSNTSSNLQKGTTTGVDSNREATSRSCWTACFQYYQYLLDRSTPHLLTRWFCFLLLVAVYALRIYLIRSHHIITYAYAIYLLSLLIGFLTPKIDPAWSRILRSDDFDEDVDYDGGLLPTNSSDEYRPFMRRLPEFRCWLNATRASLIAFSCTLTRVFDVPVFWPILVIYFFMLFILTMKRQIAHMIRYRYLPFSFGKRRYRERPQVVNAAGEESTTSGNVIHS